MINPKLIQDKGLRTLLEMAATTPAIRTTVFKQYASLIRSSRANAKSNARDRLADKAGRYGNSGGWASEQLAMLSRRIFQAKGVSMDGVGAWVSVEIECLFTSSRNISAFVTAMRKAGLTHVVTLKDDSSVHAENDCECDADAECECGGRRIGKEIVVSFKRGEPPLTLATVCKTLADLGCTVNKTCGLHVHFDMRDKSARSVATIAKKIAACVPALKTMLPKSRQNNSYCSAPINGFRTGSRYAFVNCHSYRKHKTLEIRGHSGTIDADKILNWIGICAAIMFKRGTIENQTTMAGVIGAVGMPADLADYAFRRVNQFNPAVVPAHAPAAAEDDVAADMAA